MENRQIAVVIPCFNESRVIRETIQPLIDANYTVIAVDDGSRDDTYEILRSLPICSLRHSVNLGQGAALQTGVEFALTLSETKVVVHFDADGQHSHSEIASMITPILSQQADVVLGSRFLDESHKAVPLKKRILLRGARVVNYWFTGLSLSDAHNGFRAMSRQAASVVKMSEPGFTHASEILWLIREQKLRYVEFPTHIQYTAYSMAKGQSMFNAFNILWDLVLMRLLR